MRVELVVESCFGNTSQVAAAIAEGIAATGAQVRVLAAADAPARLEADLVLVGAPTHNLGLPSASSRSQASQRQATAPATGVREWIDGIEALGGRVIAFSTKVESRFAGAASKAIVKALKRRRVTAERGADFVVAGTVGPLVAGELERAREWGRTLAG